VITSVIVITPVITIVIVIIPVIVIVITIITIVIVIAIVERPQEMIEGLRGDTSPLSSRRRVREAEMNPQVDACFDHFVGQI